MGDNREIDNFKRDFVFKIHHSGLSQSSVFYGFKSKRGQSYSQSYVYIKKEAQQGNVAGSGQ